MELEIQKYDPRKGAVMDLEDGFQISVNADIDGSIVIRANQAGLISLAKLCLFLAQPEVPIGCHHHLDDANILEDGSIPLTLSKLQI